MNLGIVLLIVVVAVVSGSIELLALPGGDWCTGEDTSTPRPRGPLPRPGSGDAGGTDSA